MSKKNKNQQPNPGKCDPIEGIILGNQIPTTLKKKLKEQETPEYLIKRITRIIEQTASPEIKEKAEKAIKLLSEIPQEKQKIPLSYDERYLICREVCYKPILSQTL